MRNIFLVLVLGVLVGCASNTASRKDVVYADAALLASPTIKLSSYKNFELARMDYSDEIKAEAPKVEVAKQVEMKLRLAAEADISAWSAAASEGADGKTVVITPFMKSLRAVSGGARFWAGAFAGDSFVDMELRITDKDTGELLANPTIRKTAGGMAGAYSGGGTDDSLLDYVAEIAHAYLVINL